MGNNNLLFMAVIWGGLILFMAWSGKKRKKKEQEKMDSLREGIEVLTIGGIKGKIVKINDQYADIKVANGVIITFRKTAIAGPIASPTTVVTENTIEDSETK